MPIAIDFGTSNTALARWNEATRRVDMVRAPALGRVYGYRLPADAARRQAFVVPSLIHYGERDQVLAGAQVEERGLVDHPGTFRWLKLDLLNDNRGGRRLDGKLVTNFQAAQDLLARILLVARELAGDAGDELIVTVPVEAEDRYVDWLLTAVSSFPGPVRVLDEATACILGYLERVRNGDVYAVVDFGGGTLDVSIVRTDLEAEGTGKCVALGRKGEQVGGGLIDDWLLSDLATRQSLDPGDIADVGPRLLLQVEQAKIDLSCGAPEATVTQFNDRTGRLINHTFRREDLIRILRNADNAPRRADVNLLLSRTIRGALDAAADAYGTRWSEVRGVFLVGGSSLLLGMSDVVRTLFPDCPLYCDSPFEAVASGACRYLGGDVSARLVHDYCLRSWDRERKDHELVVIVPKGTPFPTEGPISARYLDSACEGAMQLELVVVERSHMVRPDRVYRVGPNGALCVATILVEDKNTRELNRFPDFLHADPPCRRDEKRFVAAFGVDGSRRLTLSLRDLRDGNRSYIKLTSGETIPLPIDNFPLVRL